jgi:bifunctional N-acetylglucosamine-1-phosphate-uridyltransferase/glucosamine-1-phosphate-acetyltransferase GlmU-like protein
MKNSIMLRGAKAPHFAYVGDSILGHRVNLGAGTKLSNLPITSGSGQRPSVNFETETDVIDTGLTKLGAILGDDVETGCNVVLSPGVVIGQRSLVYPGVCLAKGLYASDTIIKLRQERPTAVRVASPASVDR